MVAIAAHTNMATLALLLVTVACHVIVTSACVPLDCVYQDEPPPQTDKYTLRDPWIIFAIILACIFFVIILLILLWLCCFCCYRNESDTAPAIVRRVVHVRRPQKQVVVCEKPKPKCLHVVAPPVECIKPPPPPPPPPVQKVIIVSPPPPPQPTSLTLTVSDACNSSTVGPTATTLVERPLKFTFTPSYNNNQQTTTTTCGYRTRDVTPTSCDVTVPAQRRCKCRHGAVCAACQHHV